MLALNSAMNAIANSNMVHSYTARWYVLEFDKRAAFQDGFVARQKWFRFRSFRPLPASRGRQS